MKLALIAMTIVLLGLSLIRSPYPHEQLLQHIPTVLAIVALAAGMRKKWLTTIAFSCVVGFIWLHILGARYIYSFVPYDELATTLFGSAISDWFGWERNHYDRLVHFSFGALSMWPVTEVSLTRGALTRKWAIAFALFAVLGFSAFYEVFEWLIAVVMSPSHADAYNGQQGDFWDAQKDMALAFAGSVVAIPLIGLCNRDKPKAS